MHEADATLTLDRRTSRSLAYAAGLIQLLIQVGQVGDASTIKSTSGSRHNRICSQSTERGSRQEDSW